MKYSTLLMTTSLCAVTAFPVLAQSRPFSEIDTDGDRALSQSELEAAFGANGAARVLARSDRNGDGVVTTGELRVSQGDDEDDDENDESDEDDDENGDEGDENDESSDEDDDEDSDDSDESDDDEDDEDSDEDDGESRDDEDDED